MPEDENNHHIVLSWLLGESHNPVELLESYLVSNILLDNSASPLRKALENTDLGKSLSPLTGLEADHKELVFAAGLEGVDSNKQIEVEKLILDCLEDIVSKGVSDELVKSSLHQLEIKQREITGSGMPYGLQIMLSCLPACLHNDDPLKVLDLDSSFDVIKKNIKTKNYIEKLIKEKIINNQHRVNYCLAPDVEFNLKNEKKIQKKIEEKSKKLTDEDKKRIIELTKNLKLRQEQSDNPEILPKVTKEDIPKVRCYAESESYKNDNKNFFYRVGTNGITYHSIILPCSPLTNDEFKVASLFTNTLTDVGLGDKSYEDIQKIQSAYTGGISANFTLIPNENQSAHNLGLKITSKSLEENEKKMQDLMIDTAISSNFSDKKRIKDMLNFISSDNEKSLIQNGHLLSMSNAAAQINNISATNDFVSGLNYIVNTNKLSKNIDSSANLNKYIELLSSIKNKISSEPLYTFTASSLDMNKSKINFAFNDNKNSLSIQNYFDIQEESVGWITGAQVTYCAEAFPTVDFFHEDAPALSVLGAVLRNGYLHSAIREKGGAYGSGAMQDSNNKIFKFFSYRDPKCSQTFQEFKKSREWSLKNITQDQLDEGILGIVSNIDKPLSPFGEAMSDFSMNLDKKDLEKRLEMRSLVKNLTLNDLINVSQKYLFNESKKSVIAGKNYIDEMKKMNFEIKNI